MNSMGYMRVACATVKAKKANPAENSKKIIELINAAESKGTGLLVFPQLALTGSDCGQLFFQKQLYTHQMSCLDDVIAATEGKNLTVAIGHYTKEMNRLYNCYSVIRDGEICGTTQMQSLTRDQLAYFSPANEDIMLYSDEENTLGFHGNADLAIISKCENPMVGQFKYAENQACAQSGENNNVTIYISTSGLAVIAENGKVISKKSPFQMDELTFADVDLDLIHHERALNAAAQDDLYADEYYIDSLHMWNGEDFYRPITAYPFEPATEEELYENCYEIFEIQANALAERLAHTHSKVSVVGISGGLDSTLALLVTAYAHKKLGKPAEDIIAITMPGFGTTGRTYENALDMMRSTGATIREISIVDAVTQHFKDIEHDMADHSVTYENSQARERTQILMDIANKHGGIVVGTGDLSEEALGWCTFNGDHISMFGVNAGIPKTVIKYIVRWFIDFKLKEDLDFSKDNELLAKTLEDILDTPISPELLPPDEDGNIAQKTEDNVGPYELHDFFIYHTVRYGVTPEKLVFLAEKAFQGKYSEEFITKWLQVFYRRFFAQQFKRTCSPDSPQIGTVDLSPAHWRMPSDAFAASWLKDLQ
ncbi:MAG: NAD(+) synthase [Eubacterium sp.]|nr:NAD(+) synthase [Eubacterium sp.]